MRLSHKDFTVMTTASMKVLIQYFNYIVHTIHMWLKWTSSFYNLEIGQAIRISNLCQWHTTMRNIFNTYSQKKKTFYQDEVCRFITPKIINEWIRWSIHSEFIHTQTLPFSELKAFFSFWHVHSKHSVMGSPVISLNWNLWPSAIATHPYRYFLFQREKLLFLLLLRSIYSMH